MVPSPGYTLLIVQAKFLLPVVTSSAGTVGKLVAVFNRKTKVFVGDGVKVAVAVGVIVAVDVGVCDGMALAVCVAAMAAVCAMTRLMSTGATVGAVPGMTNVGAQANVTIIITASIGVRAFDENIYSSFRPMVDFHSPVNETMIVAFGLEKWKPSHLIVDQTKILSGTPHLKLTGTKQTRYGF
jgi:hypothetical protein